MVAINLYLLLVSTLPEAGLEPISDGAAAVFIFVVAAWQIAWLSSSRRQGSWQVAELSLNATPTEVVELMSDLSRRPEWMPVVESDRLLNGQGSEVGATYVETLRSGHQRILVNMRISEKIAARRVSIRVLCPYLLAEDYEVGEVPEGCQVSVAHIKEVSDPIALLGGAWRWGRLTSSVAGGRKPGEACVFWWL